jgi:hypothetical protein
MTVSELIVALSAFDQNAQVLSPNHPYVDAEDYYASRPYGNVEDVSIEINSLGVPHVFISSEESEA